MNVSIPAKDALVYECFAIDDRGDEWHGHTEGGRLVIAKKSEANVLPPAKNGKYKRIEVWRGKAEIH